MLLECSFNFGTFSGPLVLDGYLNGIPDLLQAPFNYVNIPQHIIDFPLRW